MISDVEEKIQNYASKLSDLTGFENSRKRKRAMQQLGKLNKQLSALQEEREATRLRLDETGKMTPDHNSAQEKEDSRHTLPTSKKIIKAKLKLFHDELLLFAKNKQLSLANKKFRLMQKRGYPLDVHSYGNIINVCVRCQDIDKAERYEKEMRERNLPMNIIIFTTLLKGCCEAGRMANAIELWNDLEVTSLDDKETLQINPRAISTMLRGCRRIGAVDIAIDIYNKHVKNRMHGKLASRDDEIDLATSFDYIVELVSQSLQISLVEDIISYYKISFEDMDSGNLCHMTICAARMYAMVGDMAMLGRSLESTKILLDKKIKASTTISTSVSMFLSHRRDEYRLKYDELLAYYQTNQQMMMNQDPHHYRLNHLTYVTSLMSRMIYFGSDGSADLLQIKSKEIEAVKIPFVGRLLLALTEKFGFNRIKFPIDVDSEAITKGYNKSLSILRQSLAKRILLTYFNPGDSFINLDKIFAKADSDDFEREESNNSQRYMLEIGSGSGDWIVDQAGSDQGREDRWIALELRCDRVYDIATKSILRNLSNISIFGGDANIIVSQHIQTNSIHKIFVNFPEPPHHSSGIGDSQGKHLYTYPFFKQLYRILKDYDTSSKDISGTVTIVSDNFSYLQSIAHMLAEETNLLISRIMKRIKFHRHRHRRDVDMRNEVYDIDVIGFQSVSLSHADDLQRAAIEKLYCPKLETNRSNDPESAIASSEPESVLQDDSLGNDPTSNPITADRGSIPGISNEKHVLGYIEVLRGHNMQAIGHCASSSSYFDRLWENGQKTKRWSMCLRKLSWNDIETVMSETS